MVLGSPLLADERRARPRKYVLYPALIVVGCFALGLVVAYTQRFTGDGRLTADLWPWMLYIGLLWVGHFWHFGNQEDVLAGITPEAELVVGLVFGFFLCEQILHYYCDRCLFRFRDEGVRRRVAPLLL